MYICAKHVHIHRHTYSHLGKSLEGYTRNYSKSLSKTVVRRQGSHQLMPKIAKCCKYYFHGFFLNYKEGSSTLYGIVPWKCNYGRTLPVFVPSFPHPLTVTFMSFTQLALDLGYGDKKVPGPA